jgi:septal ring factor EnvC (AmiA/AmiB activator)
MMSVEVIFLLNAFMAVCGAFGAWILKSVSAEQKNLAEAHRRISERMDNLPNLYARRDDMKEAMHAVQEALARIESKIDKKADK